jgi:hypothetical protein
MTFEECWAYTQEHGRNFIIDKTHIGDIEVSTVFLSHDHNYGFADTRPILFETMVFGGEWESWQWRYASLAAAKAGHDRVVAALTAGENLGEIEVAS